MFGLFERQSRTRSPRFRNRVPLRLEALEARDCPAALQIILNEMPLTNNQVQLSGMVVDDNPASVQISFSGAVSGVTTANADGTYSYIGTVTGSAALVASGTDAAGQTYTTAPLAIPTAIALNPITTPASNVTAPTGTSSGPFPGSTSIAGPAPTLPPPVPTTIAITPTIPAQAPVVTFTATVGSGNNVTLAGAVSDANPGGLTVYFTGALTTQVTTQADGSFTLTVPCPSLGVVQATVTDAAGLAAVPATASITCPPPILLSFNAAFQSGSWWTFSGVVTGPSCAGDTVTLGGLNALTSRTATVDANGDFSLTLQLQPSDTGTATAYATDAWGQASNIEYSLVSPTT